MSGAAITWIVKYNSDVSLYLYGAVGVISSVIIGYISSLIFPGNKSTGGNTYASLVKKKDKKKIIICHQSSNRP